jgi:preprotein translocase subunit SecF
MLVGILTGTYSSIAIASPLLLWGRAHEEIPATAAPATA